MKINARELSGIIMILIVIVLLLLGWSYIMEGKPITQGVPVTGVTPTLDPVIQMIRTVVGQSQNKLPSGRAP